MCDYCSKIKPKKRDMWVEERDFKNDSIAEKFDAIIEGNKLIVSYDAYSSDSSFHEEIKINYCFMCGRSLANV